MEIIELNERATDAWNRHDRDAFLALYADDCEIVTPDTTVKGREGALQFWTLNHDPFPDSRLVVRRVVSDGSTLVEESVFEGTNTDVLPMPDGTEVPATGASASLPYVGVHTFRGDRCVSSHFYWDQLSMLQQLGLLQG